MINREHLKRIADFLEFDPRVKDHFDLSSYVDLHGQEKLGDCGTTACAVGWFPHIFPESWEYRMGNIPYLADMPSNYLVREHVAVFLLGLDALTEYLPDDDLISKFFYNQLDCKDPMVVVKMIRDYLSNNA